MLRLSRGIGIGYLVICALTLAATALYGPLGYAPLPLRLGPAGEPITVTIWYGTEKKDWLEAAKARFEQSNPTLRGRPIQIELRGQGSAEMAQIIGRESFSASDQRPTVASPASSIWLPVMEQNWEPRHSGAPLLATGNEAPQALVLTPLVLVVWEERAKVIWPNNATDGQFWPRVHDALASQSWAQIGGKPEWGQVKLGHTSPLLSNSGAQALELMAYGYYHKTSGLSVGDVTNPDFQKWLLEIESTVPQFGESTGTFMNEMILKGPGAYDMALVYENLAIGRVSPDTRNGRVEQAQGRQGQPIRVYYPPSTVLSDHPYAILNAPWVTTEQRAAAAQFRDFLLSRPIQELALEYGFRPGDPNVSIATSDPDNPFVRYKDYGVQIQLTQQVAPPDTQALTELIEFWRRKVNR